MIDVLVSPTPPGVPQIHPPRNLGWTTGGTRRTLVPGRIDLDPRLIDAVRGGSAHSHAGGGGRRPTGPASVQMLIAPPGGRRLQTDVARRWNVAAELRRRARSVGGDMVAAPSRSGADERDADLIRALFAEHGGAVLAYATRLTRGDRAAAEDVLQETLVRAWRKPDLLVNGRGSVRAWLLTVAHNIVVDQARARAARPTEVAETAAEPSTRDHSTGVVDSVVLVDALHRLTDEHRSVLVEMYFRGRTVREAADELGIPPGTVKSRTYHALRALRATMDRPAPTWDGVPA